MKLQIKHIVLGGIYLIAIISVLISGIALMMPSVLDSPIFGFTIRSIAPILGLLTVMAGILWVKKN